MSAFYSGFHVVGVIEAKEGSALESLLSHMKAGGIYCLGSGGLYAIVKLVPTSAVNLKGLSSGPRNAELVLGDMTGHKLLLEKISQRTTVLPFQFDIVLSAEPALKEMLTFAREADEIVVARLDRFTRSSAEFTRS